MRRPKTYLEIEESRNRRLWFKEVVLPLAAISAYIFSNQNNRDYVAKKGKEIKDGITRKLDRVLHKRDQ